MKTVKFPKLLFVMLAVAVFAPMISAQNKYTQKRVNYLEYWALISEGQEGTTTVTIGFMRAVGKKAVVSLPVTHARGFMFKDVSASSITVEDGTFVLKYKVVLSDCGMIEDIDRVVLEFFKAVAVDAAEIRQKFVKKNVAAESKTYIAIKCPY